MRYIKVRRNIYFFVKLGFSCFIILFGIVLFFSSIDIATNSSLDPDSRASSIFSFFFGVLILIGGFYSLIGYFRIIPSLCYNDLELRIGKNIIPVDTIIKVTLSGKFSSSFAGFDYIYKEGIQIKTVNTEYLLYYGYYNDFYQFVQFLERIKTNRKNYKVESFNKEIHSLNNIRKYSGVIWLNFRLIILVSYGYLAFLLSHSILNTIPIGWLIFAIISLAFYYLFYKQFYYFQISDDWLVIKNHHLFWKQHYIKLSDIEKVYKEQVSSKRPDRLIVLLKNYDYQSYFAASLSKKTWERFLNDLKEKGVQVGN